MAWTRVQSNSAGKGSASPAVAFTTANLSSGTTEICAVTGYAGTTTGVSDGTNAFIKIAAVAAGGGGEVSLWALNTPAGKVGTKPTITATQSGNTGSSGILIQEVSGLATGATLALLADGTPGAAAYTSGSTAGPPSYSSAASGEYLVYVLGDQGYGTTYTVPTGSGYTEDAKSVNGSSNGDIILCYKSSTGGTETGSYGYSGGVGAGLILVAFLLASTGTSVNAGIATGTGTAQQPTGTPAITGTAGLATGTSAAALLAGPAVGVTAGLAAGTGTAQPVAMTIAAATTATGTAGVALAAASAIGVTAGLAQGTGTAQNATGTPAVAATAGLATGTAAAALNPAISKSGSAAAGVATATGTALGVSMATPMAGLATGTGAAQDAGTSFSLTAAGFATGTGTAQPAFTVTAGLARGTGTAQDATGVPAITATAGLATGTGTALGIGQSASFAAGRATGTAGTAQAPGTSDSFAAGFSTGTGTAWPGVISSVVSPVLTGSGFGSFPQVPANAVVLSVVAAIVQHGSNAQIGVPSYELWDGTSARIGAVQFGTASTTVGHTDSIVFTGVSYSQLATLQLRIYATSESGNSGATVSVDAVSLSVSWAAGVSATVAPSALAVVPVIPAPSASGVVNVTVTPGVLAAAAAFPEPSAGFAAAAIFPGVLMIIPVVRAAAAAAGTLVTPGVLAVVPAFPAISDITVPGWATADSSGGSWANPGNIIGPPDGQSAVWTVP